MRWLYPIYLIYSLMQNYVAIFYSILNQMFIPHKLLIDDPNRNYDIEVYSHEPKRIHFSNIEKQILLHLIQNEKNIIDLKTEDATSLYKKRQAWERITKEFNSYEVTTKKTVYQLRAWWGNYKKKLPLLQRKELTFEQIGEGNWECDLKNVNSDISDTKEISTLVDVPLENFPERTEDSLAMDKSTKYRKNVETLYDLHSDQEVSRKLSKTHEQQLQELQLREIEKRYEIIQDESKMKLDILKMQLKQEELKTIHAERDLEVQKQKIAILGLDIKQKEMDIEMRDYLLKEKQIKSSSKSNKH